MKGLFQCPPRATPWVSWHLAMRPVRAKALNIAHKNITITIKNKNDNEEF